MKKFLKLFGLISLKEHESKIKELEIKNHSIINEMREVCLNPDSFDSLMIKNRYHMEKSMLDMMFFGEVRFKPWLSNLNGIVSVNDGTP